ncbi:MAG: sporulation protein YqfD [Clostridiales bacterium]|jgi:sporulation protein YqfD|nr:sporulation protein YqfD [Clostridiales bacterium]
MGYVTFCCDRALSGKVLSGLTAHNIAVFFARDRGDEFVFCTNRNEKQKTVAFFEQVCYNYQIIGENGFFYRIGLFLGRKGLIAGILIISVVLGLIASRLASVEVYGLKTVGYSEVVGILEREGATVGANLRKLDKRRLEYAVTSSIERIAFTSVKIVGMTLIVNVYEELPPPDIPDMTAETPVTAKKDGIVTRIIVFQGTAVAEIDKPVRAGDMLIAPVQNIGGLPVGIRAVGDVYARVYYTGHAMFFETQTVSSRTGRTAVVSELYLFGKRIGKSASSPYKVYAEEVRREYLTGPLPISVVRYYYHELTAETLTMVFEEEFPALFEKAKRAAYASLPAGSEVLNEWHIVKQDPNGVKTLEYYCEIEEKIS